MLGRLPKGQHSRCCTVCATKEIFLNTGNKFSKWNSWVLCTNGSFDPWAENSHVNTNVLEVANLPAPGQRGNVLQRKLLTEESCFCLPAPSWSWEAVPYSGMSFLIGNLWLKLLQTPRVTLCLVYYPSPWHLTSLQVTYTCGRVVYMISLARDFQTFSHNC